MPHSFELAVGRIKEQSDGSGVSVFWWVRCVYSTLRQVILYLKLIFSVCFTLLCPVLMLDSPCQSHNSDFKRLYCDFIC